MYNNYTASAQRLWLSGVGPTLYKCYANVFCLLGKGLLVVLTIFTLNVCHFTYQMSLTQWVKIVTFADYYVFIIMSIMSSVQLHKSHSKPVIWCVTSGLILAKTFVQHLYNVGPKSWTLVQHCINVMQMFCVYWVDLACLERTLSNILRCISTASITLY